MIAPRTADITKLPSHGGARIRGGSADSVGRGVTYILKRLKRDRPDLLKRVVSGEISANAAALAAGFRKTPSALDRLDAAWAQASAKQRRAFLAKVGR